MYVKKLSKAQYTHLCNQMRAFSRRRDETGAYLVILRVNGIQFFLDLRPAPGYKIEALQIMRCYYASPRRIKFVPVKKPAMQDALLEFAVFHAMLRKQDCLCQDDRHMAGDHPLSGGAADES
jgi:hypothetical protein